MAKRCRANQVDAYAQTTPKAQAWPKISSRTVLWPTVSWSADENLDGGKIATSTFSRPGAISLRVTPCVYWAYVPRSRSARCAYRIVSVVLCQWFGDMIGWPTSPS